VSDWNRALIEEFRANEGHVNGRFAGEPLLLLNSTGAKSGQVRTHPMLYLNDNGNYIVIASKGGAATHPDWYYNLTANPKAAIEVGNETIQVAAREATGVERDRYYAKQASRFPFFNEYQAETDRTIPVFVLTPQASQPSPT